MGGTTSKGSSIQGSRRTRGRTRAAVQQARRRASAVGVSLFAAGTLLLAACSSSPSPSAASSSSSAGSATSSQAPIPITIAFPGNEAALPVYVAKAKGYFAQKGLDVTYKTITNITDIVPLLGKGVDIGFGTQPILLQAASHGLNVIEVADNELVPSSKKEYVLIGAKGVTSVSQLAGQTIGAATIAGTINAATLYTLDKDGINIKSVKVIQVLLPNALATLQSGQVAASEFNEPFTAIALAHGLHALADVCLVVGNPCAMDLWMADKSWATAHTTVIADYTKALDMADKYISANTNAALKILATGTGIPYASVANTPVSDFATTLSLSSLGQWETILKAVDGVNITIPPRSLEFGQ